MPRRKGSGIQLQRKPFTVKPPTCIQIKKTAIDAKTNDDSPVKIDTTDGTDSTDVSYLHKKFKKIICTGKTDPKPSNGVIHLTALPKREEELPTPQPGRYVCPFCQLACAKPSVLQKHVRAHTNERPYPCAPCGYAFKTKSNLYKHCRSLSHRVKTGLGEPCDSAGSDISEESNVSGPETDDIQPEDSQPRIYKPKFHKAALYKQHLNSSSEEQTNEKPKLINATPELLQEHISKIIRDNQVIVEGMEPQFSKKFLQRQCSRERETSSPKSDVEVRKLHDTKSKLALALLKVDRSFSPSYQPKVNSENNTYQPLNLTKKSPAVSGASTIKEILIASREVESKPERIAQLLNNFQTQTSTKLQPPKPSTPISENDHDVGPRLGNTPLVDGPLAKKRRVQSTTVPPDPRGLHALASRRLSTSSLPSTLKSLEELSRHPMKQPQQQHVHLFGGEMQILDSNESRSVRHASSPEPPEAESRIVTVTAKTGLHASGGTLVNTASPVSTPSAPAFHMASILCSDSSPLTIAPDVTTPNLSVPGVPQPDTGVCTIYYCGESIPYVPGMPGPQTLMSEPRRRSPKPIMSSQTQPSSSNQNQQNVPNDVPKIEISSPPAEEAAPPMKFRRPTSLPLKPGSFTPKRLHQGTTPTVLSLVSPETPRPKKSYGQLFLNGHAYTYLGLKCSTRPYYCTISRPQPMYVVQSPQFTRLSMYSNWKVYSETDPLGLTPGQAMAQYDSRFRVGGFTTADSRKKGSGGIITHSSSWRGTKLEPSAQEAVSEPERKRQRICSGGYESLEDYTYVRGRGRGRYVCEECGIRCKKPSMLKKHIRSHSDVRPYSCQHCAFAFKTKGNLNKHFKSKSHFKRCSELGVDPTPPVLFDGETENAADDSGSSETESEDSDEDYDSNGGTEALEREAACGLLSLSSSPRVSQCVAAGLLPRASFDSRPSCYPYSTAQLKNAQVQTEAHTVQRDEEIPIDLSQKDRNDPLSFLSKNSQFLQHSLVDGGDVKRQKVSEPSLAIEKPLQVIVPPSPSVPAYLAASIASLQESRMVEPPGGHMMQAYLTAKAVRDVQIKQQQRSRTPDLAIESTSTTAETIDSERLVMNLPNDGSVDTISRLEIDRDSGGRLLVPRSIEGDATKRVIVSIPSQQESGFDERVAGALSKTHDANLKAEFFPPASGPHHSYVSVTEDGRSICVICNKTFSKPSQLRLHVNIHYFERPFRCEACAVSFRTKGLLQKHERSVYHHNKVSMNTTFGAATTANPRPFKCDDCKIAFRIHGHLAKHLRSKMHIMKLECIGKLPFGTYAELERSGFNLNEIDTTDCDNSLESLQALAQKLYEKDSSKFGQPISDQKPSDEGAADSDSNSSEGLQTDQVQCGVCGEPCDSPAALQVHMFADHNRETVLDKRKPDD